MLPQRLLKPPSTHIPKFAACPSFQSTVLPNGWAVAILDIDPDLATEMLQRNVNNQRKVINATVERYAADMSSGAWRLTHQGIAFNAAGHLNDGQHRLQAVITSGTTIPMLVFFTSSGEREMTVTDTGKGRTALDAAHVLGWEADKDTMATIAQMAKLAREAKHGFTVTHSKMLALYATYGERAREVCRWFHSNKVRGTDRAPIRAAVLAALVTEHTTPEVLQRFVSVLTDKLPGDQPADSSARTLRQYITNNVSATHSGFVITADLYLRTCQALLYAVENRETKLVRPCARSPFVVNTDDPTAAS